MGFNPIMWLLGIGTIFVYWIVTKVLGDILPSLQGLFTVGSTAVYIIALLPTAIFFGFAYSWLESAGVFGGSNQ